jgi:hypothetical protein
MTDYNGKYNVIVNVSENGNKVEAEEPKKIINEQDLQSEGFDDGPEVESTDYIPKPSQQDGIVRNMVNNIEKNGNKGGKGKRKSKSKSKKSKSRRHKSRHTKKMT